VAFVGFVAFGAGKECISVRSTPRLAREGRRARSKSSGRESDASITPDKNGVDHRQHVLYLFSYVKMKQVCGYRPLAAGWPGP
jgi:hypothetical protein